jgi:hypothetical protein
MRRGAALGLMNLPGIADTLHSSTPRTGGKLGGDLQPRIARALLRLTQIGAVGAATARDQAARRHQMPEFQSARDAKRDGGAHSSGIPALRRPAKKVASYKARIFGSA